MWANHLQAQMRSQVLDFPPQFNSQFRLALKVPQHTNGVQKRAILWFLHFFGERLDRAALNGSITLGSKFYKFQKEVTITSYLSSEGVNYFMEMYAIIDVITGMEQT